MTAPTFLALLSVPWLGAMVALAQPFGELVLALNAGAGLVFCLDKLQAVARRTRVPELALHVVMLVAPAGASLGRRLASHKTLHASFDASAVAGFACGAALLLAR